MWLCSSSMSIIEDRDPSVHLDILTIAATATALARAFAGGVGCRAYPPRCEFRRRSAFGNAHTQAANTLPWAWPPLFRTSQYRPRGFDL
jgi:hypothetical protein